MTNMEQLKVTLDDSANTLNLSMPIIKVDKENRLVSGFATADNIDAHKDRVTAEASQKAFDNFIRRNVREMHMPIAVGKMLSYENKKVIDPDTGEEYNGVYVTARISKGAQDTWEKVLDGTLSGFSIGATLEPSDYEIKLDDEGNKYRQINKYDIYELSLVDAPANNLANVLTIQKRKDGEIEVSGIAVDGAKEHMDKFYDPNSLDGRSSLVRQAFYSENPETREWVMNIYNDYVITQDGENYYRLDYELVDGDVIFSNRRQVDVDIVITEKQLDGFFNRLTEWLEKRIGGNSMSDKTEKVADVDEVETEETDTEVEDTQKSVDVDALADTLVEKVLERLEKAGTVGEAETETVEEEVEEETETVEVEKADNGGVDSEQLLKSFKSALDEAVETLKGSLENLESRVESVEKSTAKRKSSDVDGEEETVEKSVWGDAFLATSDL